MEVGGSYNECNERALGSDWLDFSDYETYEEIEEELKKQGFELEGIDEELFIQDIEGIDDNGTNWDYVHPQSLFETLKESGILDDDYKYKTFEAFLEVESFSEFERRVEDSGDRWDDNIYIYENYSWYDLGYYYLHDYHEIPDFLDCYIDYERYGEEFSYSGYREFSKGIIYIN